MRHPKRLRIITKALPWLASILLLFFIWSFSTQDAPSSTALSQGVTHWLAGFLIPNFAHMNAAQQSTVILNMNHYVRKAAHFGEFMCLGFALLFAFRGVQKVAKHAGWLALLFGILAAATDEFIQLFEMGRGAMLTDVLLDASGVLCGVAVATLLVALVKRFKCSPKNAG